MKALQEKETKSSMRVALFTVLALSALMILMICSYIVLSLCMAAAINWQGVTTFLGAIGVFMTPAFTGKAIQKKFEK